MSTTTMNSPLIEMRSIHKAFGGVRAVDDVSLSVFPGPKSWPCWATTAPASPR